MGKRKGWRVRGLLLGCFVFVACVSASVAWPQILTWMARLLMLSQTPEPADLVLVLGGDFLGSRVFTGAELGARGYAKRVMISGPPYQGRPESDFAITFLAGKGYPRDLFVGFPNNTQSTIDEAIAVCPELRRRGAKRVLLVTSDYHSLRANVVYRLFCPQASFRSIAARDTQFQPERWWRTPRYREVFFSEWEKIFGTIFWKYPEYLWHSATSP